MQPFIQMRATAVPMADKLEVRKNDQRETLIRGLIHKSLPS